MCTTTARPAAPVSGLGSSYADSQSKKPQPSVASSRRATAASCQAEGGTSTVSCPKLTCADAPSTRATTRSPSSSGDISLRRGRCTDGRRCDERGLQGLGLDAADVARWRPVVALVERLTGDLVLKLQDAVQQRLGARRAAGHGDVDGDQLVDSLGDRVAVPVGTAAVGTGAHRDDVLRFGHLLVETQDRGRHLVGDGAADHHQVRLAGTGRERDHAEADEVVPGHRRSNELDRAAGEAEVEDPEAVAAAPVQDKTDRLWGDLLARPQFRTKRIGLGTICWPTPTP